MDNNNTSRGEVDMNSTVILIESLITLLENSPALIELLNSKKELSPEQVSLYRERIRMAMDRVSKTWEDYIREAEEEAKLYQKED